MFKKVIFTQCMTKTTAITYALFDPSMFIFCFQRSEIQQNQGFTARILQTFKKPQYAVSVNVF